LRRYVAGRRAVLVPREVFIRATYAPGDHYVEFRVMLSRNRDRFLAVPSHAYPLSIIPPRSNSAPLRVAASLIRRA
jgi:hypothetical protein